MRINGRRLLIAALPLALLMAGPAGAQTDLSGTWVALNHKDGLERGNGPYAVDYTGIPMNEDARALALSHTESLFGMIEHQCGMWPQHYIVRAPFNLKIWNEVNPMNGATIAWKLGAWQDRGETTIWMDGRPQPSPNAPHDRQGFATGRWEGSTLVVNVTHMNGGGLRRNGAPSSDQATMTLRFLRHGDLLTLLAVIEDPIYLTEPYIQSASFERNPDAAPSAPFGPTCIPTYEWTSGDGRVPSFLPGQNPSIDELTKLYGIPREATLGGAETMYPEYRKKLKAAFVLPERCRMNCSPLVGNGGTSGPAVAPPPRPAPASGATRGTAR